MATANGNDPYARFTDGHIKHLEMIQGVVARLGGNGFVVKGWAVTLVGAFLGFSMARDHAGLALIVLLLVPFFWFLDASFLRAERAFRLLFERVRTDGVDPFFMNATSSAHVETLNPKQREWMGWPQTIRRPALSLFYGALILSAATTALYLHMTPAAESADVRPTESGTEVTS